jgi:hypothetical protein
MLGRDRGNPFSWATRLCDTLFPAKFDTFQQLSSACTTSNFPAPVIYMHYKQLPSTCHLQVTHQHLSSACTTSNFPAPVIYMHLLSTCPETEFLSLYGCAMSRHPKTYSMGMFINARHAHTHTNNRTHGHTHTHTHTHKHTHTHTHTHCCACCVAYIALKKSRASP